MHSLTFWYTILLSELQKINYETNAYIFFNHAEKKRLAARQRDEAWEGTLGEKWALWMTVRCLCENYAVQ